MSFNLLFLLLFAISIIAMILSFIKKCKRFSVFSFAVLQVLLVFAMIKAQDKIFTLLTLIFSEEFKINLTFSINGLSIIFLSLTSLIYLYYFLYLTFSKKEINSKEVSALLLLYLLFIAFFTSVNLIAAFTFFEAMLIPSSYLLGSSSNSSFDFDRVKKYLSYNLIAGGFLLFSIFQISLSSPELIDNIYSKNKIIIQNNYLLTAVIIGILIATYAKSPFFPLYQWVLPLAEQSKARTLGLLSGLIDKTGIFFLTIIVLKFYNYKELFILKKTLLITGIIGLCYFMLLAYKSQSFKKTLAFISIAHYSVMLLGISYLTHYSFYAVLFYILAHGITTFLIFLLLDYMEENSISNTDLVKRYGFLTKILLLLIFAIAALPASSNFIGELLIVIASFKVGLGTVGFLIILSSLLSMWILIKHYNKILISNTDVGGDNNELPNNKGLYSFLFLLGLCTVLILGIYPHYFLKEGIEFLNSY